jgi:hypothetical protein
LGKRATSFGYGNKYTLENKERNPPPNNYQKVGFFEDSTVKRKGYSFSHDNKKGPVNEIEVRKTPGPGKYSYKTDKMDFQKVSYSFRGKYEDPLERGKNVQFVLFTATWTRTLSFHIRPQSIRQLLCFEVSRFKMWQDRKFKKVLIDQIRSSWPWKMYNLH